MDLKDDHHERIMQLMIDRMPGFTAYLDKDLVYRKVNKIYVDFYKKPYEEIIGKHISQLAMPEVYERAKPKLDIALSGQRVKFDNVIINASGDKLYVETEYFPDVDPKSGEVIGVVVNAFDVTHRKNQELWLQEILNNLPIGLVMTEPDTGNYSFSNKAANDFYGKAFPIGTDMPKYAQHMEVYDMAGNLLSPLEFPSTRAAQGEIFKNEVVRWVTTKGEFYMSCSSAIIPQMHGHGKTVLVPFLDISEIIRSQKLLEDAVRGRDEFLSIASHELKTPLTSIQLQTQMSKRRLEKNLERPIGNEELIKIVHQTELGLKRLNRLVDDMLDVSRINSGKLSFNYEKFNFKDLAYEVMDRMQPLAKLSDTQILIKNDHDAVGEWDRFRLEQVLTNLISNALKYGDSTPVEIEFKSEAGFFTFSVSDKGPGISQEFQEKIFERFEREGSRDSVAGLGLGLYICREIINRHEGRIWVESSTGKGAKFLVRLPVY